MALLSRFKKLFSSEDDALQTTPDGAAAAASDVSNEENKTNFEAEQKEHDAPQCGEEANAAESAPVHTPIQDETRAVPENDEPNADAADSETNEIPDGALLADATAPMPKTEEPEEPVQEEPVAVQADAAEKQRESASLSPEQSAQTAPADADAASGDVLVKNGAGRHENAAPEIKDADCAVADGEAAATESDDTQDGENSEATAEQESFFNRVFKGLARTRKRLAARLLSLFGASKLDDAFWDELEEILISADVGMEPTLELTKRLKTRLRQEGVLNPADVPPHLYQEIASVFVPMREPEAASPQVALVIGVNGVGKTTTIAKLAHLEKEQGKKVLIVAADTFRAAAVEQLETWAQRVGCAFYAKGQGADPAAVAYEALDLAQKEHIDTVFVDTAGRLHTKTNLMEELLKIRRVLNKRLPGAPHRTILVMDATTGQNGLSQAKLFGESCGIDELILTKLDGTAKGGIAVAIAMQFGIPISHVGLGEGMRDLRPFEPETFVKALLDTKE